MNDMESEGKLSNQKNKGKSDSDAKNAKKLKQRVEEFKLWNDDNEFVQIEYEKRRTRRKNLESLIRSDRGLQIAKAFYIPCGVMFFLGICLLLLSTIDGLATDTVMWHNRIYFQVAGAVILSLGIIMLMVIAAFNYNREDSVRAKFGFPTVFESARNNQVTSKHDEESLQFTCDFVDRTRSNSRLSRMTSVESKASLSNLGLSFSSTSTAMSWLHKHKREHSLYARNPLRRENSDSALDTCFARNRILSWQSQVSEVESNCTEKEAGEDCCGGKLDPNVEKSNDGTGDSQAYSSISTTSSGYHSTIPSPSPQKTKSTFTYPRPFSESGSGQYDNDTRTSQDLVFSLPDENPNNHSEDFAFSLPGDKDTHVSQDLVFNLPDENGKNHSQNCAFSLPGDNDTLNSQDGAFSLPDDTNDCETSPTSTLIPLIPIIIVETFDR